MVDQLGVAWQQDEPRRRRPSNRQRQEERRRRRRRQRVRSWLVLLVVCAVLGYGTYMGVGWAIDEFGPKDFAAGDRSTSTVDVRVKPGSNGEQMAEALVDAGVIKTIEGFIIAFDAGDGEGIQPGTWTLFKRMTSPDVVAALLDRQKCSEDPAPPCRVVNTVTIPEGFITLEIYTKVSDVTGVSVDEFTAAAVESVAVGVPEAWFTRTDGVSAPQRSIEGFLFPATYDFDGGMSATEILQVMVKKFLAVATEVRFAETVQAGLGGVTPYEALIAASVAQAEAKTEADQAMVARVVYNRVFSNLPRVSSEIGCPCLQLDSSINYSFKIQGDTSRDPNEFHDSEIHNPNNPYNTHDKPGLPITPLGNPGVTALKGAMAPPAGNWLYFVTVDAQGTTLFADTYAKHKQNIQVACRNRVLTGSACS